MPSSSERRLYLLTRALYLPCAAGGARPVTSHEANSIMYCVQRIRRRVPGLLVEEGVEVSLFFPLLEKHGIWSFSLVHNQPSLLREFWRAVVETLFCIALERGEDSVHSLVFCGGGHEFEVTDEWGQEWYIIVRPCGLSADMRSRSNTPEAQDREAYAVRV